MKGADRNIAHNLSNHDVIMQSSCLISFHIAGLGFQETYSSSQSWTCVLKTVSRQGRATSAKRLRFKHVQITPATASLLKSRVSTGPNFESEFKLFPDSSCGKSNKSWRCRPMVFHPWHQHWSAMLITHR